MVLWLPIKNRKWWWDIYLKSCLVLISHAFSKEKFWSHQLQLIFIYLFIYLFCLFVFILYTFYWQDKSYLFYLLYTWTLLLIIYLLLLLLVFDKYTRTLLASSMMSCTYQIYHHQNSFICKRANKFNICQFYLFI
jgi:hypothetical protein